MTLTNWQPCLPDYNIYKYLGIAWDANRTITSTQLQHIQIFRNCTGRKQDTHIYTYTLTSCDHHRHHLDNHIALPTYVRHTFWPSDTRKWYIRVHYTHRFSDKISANVLEIYTLPQPPNVATQTVLSLQADHCLHHKPFPFRVTHPSNIPTRNNIIHNSLFW